ncbi:hypothetical protein KR026_001927, partial [Drosophila bipectinata]
IEEMRKHHGYQKPLPLRKPISELCEEVEGDDALEFGEDELQEEIGAFSLVCWNCRKEGHRYQDCASKRKIFCYGCGLPNAYKPSCERCTKNSHRNTATPRSKASVPNRQSGLED